MNNTKHGFALPTVIIASLVMFTVLVSAVSSISSARVVLDAQFHERLMKDASEAGAEYAKECLAINNGTPLWTALKPLRSNTDCRGDILLQCISNPCYIASAASYRTSFEVGTATLLTSGNYKMSSRGSVELLRKSDGSVAKSMQTESAVIDRFVDPPDIAGGAGWQDNGHIGFFISSTGSLYGFGDNSANQIGPSSIGAYVSTPLKMELPPGANRISKVFTSGQGASIVCVITNNGLAYCRGKPGAGEVGLMPQAEGWFNFVLPAGLTAQAISIHGQGADSACVLASNSQVYCAGDNWAYSGTNGLLGTGDTANEVIPIGAPQRFLLPGGQYASKVYAQDRLTCVITTLADLYCAGNNSYGQLGDGTTTNVTTPKKYPLPGLRKAVMVLGNYHNAGGYVVHVLANDGTIWGSGRNANGELGDNSVGTARTTPVQFGSRTDYSAMITSPDHMCGITSSGAVYCAGSNDFGQLGRGTCTSYSAVPALFVLPAGQYASINISIYGASQWHSTQVVTQSGRVYGAGENIYGKLGNGATSATQCSVVQMSLPAGVLAKNITTLDSDSVYVFGSNGAVYGAGRNNLGQLGDGTIINRSTPVSVLLPRYQLSY